MEEPTEPQEAYTDNWFDRHKVFTGISIVALFGFFLSLFSHGSGNTVATLGAQTVKNTPVLSQPLSPTLLPTATPTSSPTPSQTVPTVGVTGYTEPTDTPAQNIYIAPTHSTTQITQPTTTQAQGLSNDNYYMNSSGNEVHAPAYSNDGSVPAGATAKCADGTYSFSQHHSGTCSHHGGVAQWY
jgi:hypothetical protein